MIAPFFEGTWYDLLLEKRPEMIWMSWNLNRTGWARWGILANLSQNHWHLGPLLYVGTPIWDTAKLLSLIVIIILEKLLWHERWWKQYLSSTAFVGGLTKLIAEILNLRDEIRMSENFKAKKMIWKKHEFPGTSIYHHKITRKTLDLVAILCPPQAPTGEKNSAMLSGSSLK